MGLKVKYKWKYKQNEPEPTSFQPGSVSAREPWIGSGPPASLARSGQGFEPGSPSRSEDGRPASAASPAKLRRKRLVGSAWNGGRATPLGGRCRLESSTRCRSTCRTSPTTSRSRPPSSSRPRSIGGGDARDRSAILELDRRPTVGKTSRRRRQLFPEKRPTQSCGWGSWGGCPVQVYRAEAGRSSTIRAKWRNRRHLSLSRRPETIFKALKILWFSIIGLGATALLIDISCNDITNKL